ncbi:hypothetical protein KAW18_10400 [candidate division WOR-3 bacterium]|nr:hypothetical protein [candidate division WOR-3 bacterium]
MPKRIAVSSLILIFLSLSAYKVFKTTLERDGSCLYHGNSALHLRYARMIAGTGKIPENDKMLGFPGGFSVKSGIPLLMESLSGNLYRILPRSIPFHLYLIIFTSLYSSLIVLGVYLIAINLWNDRMLAPISSLILASALYVSANIIKPQYRPFDFALPFVLFQLYFYLRATRIEEKGERFKHIIGCASLSGVFLIGALASWRMAPFYLLIFSILVGIEFLTNSKRNLPFIIIAGFSIISGFLFPNLRGSNFLLSIPMLVIYALLGSTFFKRKTLWMVPVVSFMLIGIIISLNRYGIIVEPVFNLMLRKGFSVIGAKLVCLGGIFKNAEGLRWEDMFIWTNFLHSPSPMDSIRAFGVLLPIGLFGFFIGMKEWRRIESGERFILLCTAVLMVIYIFLEPIGVFLSFLFALTSVYLVLQFKKKALFGILLLIIPNLVILTIYKPIRSEQSENYLLQMVKFIRHRTEEESPILTTIDYGTILLTYAHRPITLNPLDVSNESIEKIKDFEFKLFHSEKDFYKFCSKYKVRYFVYHKDMLLSQDFSSLRFRTHNDVISEISPAYLFHFEPTTLTEFTLVFSNPEFRVFAVHYTDIRESTPRIEYLRVYDYKNYDLECLGIR